MKLILFDIDGTLTRTNDVDQRCFSEALEDVMGLQELKWEDMDFLQVTDPGCLREAFKQQLERSPTAEEVERIKEVFISNLEAETAEVEQFREVPGAKAIIDELRDHPDYKIAFSTGCWLHSAELKLNMVNIDYNGIPFGNADLAATRDKIALEAIRLTEKEYPNLLFEETIYVGDGLWDLKTSALLDLSFIGIDVRSSGKLAEAGATNVLRNFLDKDAFYKLLEK